MQIGPRDPVVVECAALARALVTARLGALEHSFRPLYELLNEWTKAIHCEDVLRASALVLCLTRLAVEAIEGVADLEAVVPEDAWNRLATDMAESGETI